MSDREFGRLLTEGVRHISLRESKPIQVVEDELGYAVGRNGASAIQYWRKGHRPSRLADVETLASNLARRGRVGRAWIERFLRSALHPNPESLSAGLFPDQPTFYLPTPPTRLIGREHDLHQLRARLARGEVRLLTLTGAPGVGKTRLALQLAADLRAQGEAMVAFVPLASTRNPERVPAVIAGSLAIMDNNPQALMERLKAFLRARPMLLVLDNFEQVNAAAPVVADLLLTAPKLKLLVTSRERLQLYGEHEYPVAPLALPQPASVDSVSRAPAVSLFVERAQAIHPGFALTAENAAIVAEICARTDGLPLAIELIATRSKMLAPHEMLAQLNNRLAALVGGPRDLPARQQTLQAAIEWSYELLNAAERQCFQRLGVFVGGFTLEAALAVVGEGCASRLESLVDKNLVQVVRPYGAGPRFGLLETIREYAWLRLHASEEAAEIERRQADWCLRLAERAEAELRGPDQLRWLDILEEDFPNLRAALAWSLETPARLETGLRIAAALFWFWNTRCHFGDEGRHWLDRLLEAAAETQAARSAQHAQAKALLTAGWLHSFLPDFARASALTERSLALFQALGDMQGMAAALTNLAVYELAQKNVERAATLAEDARAMYATTDDSFGIAQVFNDLLGPIAAGNQDFERAAALQQEGLALRRALGDLDGIAWSLYQLAGIARDQGDNARARALYEESCVYSQEIKNRRLYALALDELAQIALAEGTLTQAQSYFEACLAEFDFLGERHAAAWVQVNLGRVARGRGEAASAAALYEQALSAFRQIDDALCCARVQSALSMLALEQADYARAQALAEESLQCFTGLGQNKERAEAELRLARILRRAGALDEALKRLANAASLVGEHKQSTLGALYLIEAAGLAVATGAAEPAAVLAGAARPLWHASASWPERDDELEWQQIVSTGRALLGEAAFESARAKGGRLSFDEALRYGLPSLTP